MTTFSRAGRAGLLLVFALTNYSSIEAADWPRFRGPAGLGIAPGSIPTELNLAGNLTWKVECANGPSSPVISGGRLFITGVDGDQRLIECYDAATGQRLWQSSLPKLRDEGATPPGGPASPSPVADEANVYAFFPDAGLVCFARDGQERWRHDPGPFHSIHGLAMSLELAAGRVVLLVDHAENSFLATYDCQTGAPGWKATREDGVIGGYSTPATRVTAQGTLEVVVSGPFDVAGYDAATGQRNWTVNGVTNVPISAPIVLGNRVFTCEPSFNGNEFKNNSLKAHDKNKDGEVTLEELADQPLIQRIAKRVDAGTGNKDGKITDEEMEKAFASFVGGGGLAAIEIDETGPTAQARVKWTYRKSVPQIASLLLDGDALFFLNDGGILTSVNPTAGEILKRGRLGHGAKFYASPVAAGGRMLLIDTEGKAAVVSTAAEWEVLGKSDLKDHCYATPALADNKAFIRGEKHLYCFREIP